MKSNDLIPENFDGFMYRGHEIKLFSKANNHFQLLLHTGKTLSFEPAVENAEDFKEWLLAHGATDAKTRNLNS